MRYHDLIEEKTENEYFKNLDDDTIDEYIGGKCMFLAAAFHRIHGYEIQVVIEDYNTTHAYVSHAWVVIPNSGDMIDIDGRYPLSKNGWIGFGKYVTGLTEQSLKNIINKTSYKPISDSEWESEVQKALTLISKHFVQK